MRSLWISIFAVICSAIPGSVLPADVPAQKLILSQSSYIKGAGSNGPYQLPHNFILVESLKVYLPGDSLTKTEFNFDYFGSSIYLSKPLAVGDSLLVEYGYLATGLKKRYYHSQLPAENPPQKLEPASPALMSTPAPTESKTVANSSSLELKGSKSFSLEAGNRGDMQFRQGLDLAITGKVSDNVAVSAFLSDRGDFSAPTGTTQRLEELDKLKIEVKSPNFTGSLGDQEIDYTDTRLSGFTKKIKGVQSQAQFGNFVIETAVANSKGTFHTNQIKGQDGKQGPYFLSDRNGQTRIAVLTGSEKIWLDGQLLQRGSESDYTIDYYAGSIQFTPRRLITGQSFIRADFEYSQEDFSKKVVASRARMNFQEGKLKLGGSMISEGDSKDSPFGFNFSPAQKDILVSAGDNFNQARASGAVWVGDSLGDYNQTSDTLGNSCFKYVGEKKGDYQVKFTYAGEKQGEYIYQGAGVFSFVGAQQGNYTPLQSLPVPRNQSLLGLDLDYRPNAAWQIKMELAQSHLDKNAFSGLDDKDNRGWGFDSQIGFAQSGFSILGKEIKQFRSQAGLFIQDNNFSPLARISEVEEERIWNTSPGIKTSRELRWNFSPEVTLGKNLSWGGYWGGLRRGVEFSSSRKSLSATLPSLSAGSFNFNYQKTHSRQTPREDSLPSGSLVWKNQTFQWNQPAGKFMWQSRWSLEERRQMANGQKWQNLQLGFSSNTASNLAYQAEWIKTNFDSYDSGWKPSSSSQTWKWQGSLREWKRILSTSWEYTHSRINYRRPGLGRQFQNLALWRADLSPASGVINLELRYSLNQGGLDLKSYNYVKVPAGEGEYRLENGEYVPDPQGDYQLLTENSGSFRSTLSGEKTFHLTFEPGRLRALRNSKDGLEQSLSWLFSDTYLRLESQVPDNSGLDPGYLIPWQSLESDSAYLQNYSWRQELKIAPDIMPHYFVLRWEKENFQSSRYVNASQSNQNFKRTLSAYLKLGASHLLELQHQSTTKASELSGYPPHLIQGNQLLLNYTKRLSNSSQYSLSGKYLSEQDQKQSLSSQLYSISPGLTLSPSGAVRCRGKIGWSKVNTNSDYLSWLLAEGKQKGNNFDWDLGFDLRWKEKFRYSATYRGNLLAHRSPLHFVRLDLVTTF